MSGLRKVLVGGMVLAAAIAAPGLVLAAPVGIWVNVYYANWADQPPKTKTFQFQMGGPDKAATLCASQTNLMRLVAHIQRRDTFLQHEHIFSADCAMDRSGNIKTASGASLVGSK